jgi:hypothetical protein
MMMMEMIRLRIFEPPLAWVQSTGIVRPPLAQLISYLYLRFAMWGMALSCTVVYAGTLGIVESQ